MFEPIQLLKAGAMASGALAAIILVSWLIRRPPLRSSTKLWLLFGLGPLPIASALMGNLANLEVSKERRFCGSCHVMTPYTEDAANPSSELLAAAHSRNAWFGNESCYVCHADYGMFGTAATKLGGLRHVWDYYAHDWGPGAPRPALYKPYDNATCTRCHPQAGPRRPLAHEVHAAPDGRNAMSDPRSAVVERRIRLACVLSLIALGLMGWSLVDSTPIPVIVAMSLGQALGTLSLVLFLVVVLWDLRRARVLGDGDESTPPQQ